ncbi:MAG: reverse transcriptase domain-containing protein, partial [Metamycoplasmataceae bacterium]
MHDTLLTPLSQFSHVWENLPGISVWVVRTIVSGYTLQFCRNPPRFSGVLQTSVNSASEASVLRQELSSLLLKGAIEEVPKSESEKGFFSRYFIVPKKDGGLRPILDLRRLNFSLYKGKFKMLTLKFIIAQIRAGDWFVSIDLKDAYFHIQVTPRHRKFLRFAFEGKVFQYRVLPFGLALAPRTFTKCMDAALAPLRLQGIRILNYLDDWLLL